MGRKELNKQNYIRFLLEYVHKRYEMRLKNSDLGSLVLCVFLCFCNFPICALIHISTNDEVCTVTCKHVKVIQCLFSFADRSKALLLLCIFFLYLCVIHVNGK